jgi:hypothetical protein
LFYSRQAVLLDVRLPGKFEETRPAFSKNVPLFIPIQKWWVKACHKAAHFPSLFSIGE